MRLRFDTRLILSMLLIMFTSGSLAFADNAKRMAEMQKSLNAEVLAQPFSVAAPTELPAATAPTPQPSLEPSCSPRCGRWHVDPHLSLGWHFGHRSYGYGKYHGHRFHRYGYYKRLHSHRYRRH